MYACGRGVHQDYAEAAKWYRKAAEQGNVSAQTQLANLYASGQGVAQSDSEAQKWRAKAAEPNKDLIDFLSTVPSQNLGCVSVGGYYLTEKQLREMSNNGKVDLFSIGNITDVIGMYSDDITDRLNMSISDKNHAYAYLDCAFKLSMSEETIVDFWYKDSIHKVTNDKAEKDYVNAIYNSASQKICTQYNQIAMYCERNSILDKAEEIYVHVLSSYEKIDGCTKEAEFSLQKVNASKVNNR
jgi:TPR repeat protein